MTQPPYPLSVSARDALTLALVSHGPHRGQLLARCPKQGTLAAAAWHGATLSVNPYKADVTAMMGFTAQQQATAKEIIDWFEAMPKADRTRWDRDRLALETLGAW